MKNIYLILLLIGCVIRSSAQGTLHSTSGANIKTANNAFIVLDNMNVVNNGSFVQSIGDGTTKFTGNADVNISGSSLATFDKLNIAKTSAKLLLQQNVNVVGQVNFTSGLIDLTNSVLDLGTTGMVNGETETSRIFTFSNGYVQIINSLYAPLAANPGNLGAIITSAKDLGSVTIRRGHIAQPGVSGTTPGILRYYDILPTNDNCLNATLRFQYFDAELNGLNETTLGLWKQSGSWINVGYSSRDAFNNYVEKKGINALSRWTLSTAASKSDAAFVITCPSNVSAGTNTGCSYVGSIGTATITYNCDEAVTITNDAPSSFPIGVTTVTWTATDDAGNTSICQQTVTVTDNVKPTISCVSNQTRTVNTGLCSYIVSGSEFDPTAFGDNCTGATIKNSFNNSSTLAGAIFPKGTTTVVWTVTDAAGNTNTCNFAITVSSTLAATIPDVYALTPTNGTNPNTIYIGYSPASVITLIASVTGGQTVYTYSWSVSSNLSIVGANNGQTVKVTSTVPNRVPPYIVSLTVTDAYGCTFTITKQLYVVDVRCGNKNDKVTVCVFSQGKHTTSTTSCLASNAVSANLANGSYLGTCGTPPAVARVIANDVSKGSVRPLINSFDVKASPNPSNTSFKLIVESNSNESICIRLQDVSGRVISTINKVQRNQSVTLGNNLIGGTYFVEVIQGSNRKIVKLIKLN